MTTHTEIEQKFQAPPLGDVPDLAGLCDAVAESTEVDLEATYFDTDDLRLVRHGHSLRRRTGGDDEGWHLKISAGDDERIERRRPLGRATRTVPRTLLREVRALVRDRAVVPVALLRTRRIEHHLLDSSGTTLAVVADDRVRAQRLLAGASEAVVWREIEVELVDGDRELLAAIAGHLRERGLRASPFPSKLARALGLNPTLDRPDHASSIGKRSTTGEVLMVHLREQVNELTRRDRAARADEPDGVHKMRVATRRLRSAMASYRRVLGRSQTDPIRAELKWLGQLLGRARDLEVQLERLRQLVSAEPTDLVVGPVRRRIEVAIRARHRDAHAALVAELDGERYFRLLDSLDDLLSRPTLTKRAARPARAQLPKVVKRSARRVDTATKRAAEAALTSAAARDAALHELRKAAKRARYAAESVAPVMGKPAARLATRMETVQDVLGELQDSVTARTLLRELAMAADDAGENGFTFGLLHREEQARGDAARARANAAVKGAASPSLRRWLT